MMITMGARDYQGVEKDFHGVEMYWSHFGPQHNRELVEAAALTVVGDEIQAADDEQHHILMARRPGA